MRGAEEICSRIHERHGNVSCSFGGAKAFVVMRQSSGMDQGVAFWNAQYRAVVPQKTASATLKNKPSACFIRTNSGTRDVGIELLSRPYLVIYTVSVERNVHRPGRRVMMRPQEGLLVRLVAHHEHHDGVSLRTKTTNNSLLLHADGRLKAASFSILGKLGLKLLAPGHRVQVERYMHHQQMASSNYSIR